MPNLDTVKPSSVNLCGPQIRAARGLLNMSVVELAELTGLGMNTIRRAEATEGPIGSYATNAAIIANALGAEGVIFVDGDESAGPGVRLAAERVGEDVGGRRLRRRSK